MEEVLQKYLPERAVKPCADLIKEHLVYVQIVKQRKTRHGDYRKLPSGQIKITVNANLNQYRFLITFIHEFAHLVAYKKYGNRIKPHGIEWKRSFQQLMLPFIRPEIFPDQLLPLLAKHFRNPTASSDTDVIFSLALKQFDPPSSKNYIFEIPLGKRFRIENGRVFTKGKKLVKRYECTCEQTGQTYVFQPHAEVEPL